MRLLAPQANARCTVNGISGPLSIDSHHFPISLSFLSLSLCLSFPLSFPLSFSYTHTHYCHTLKFSLRRTRLAMQSLFFAFLLIASPLAATFALFPLPLYLVTPPVSYPLDLSLSLCPPLHWYNLTPLSFGALQWLHHHIGDTTALANEVSRSLSITFPLSLPPFLSRAQTWARATPPPSPRFSPNSPSRSLPCAPKAYRRASQTKPWEWAER